MLLQEIIGGDCVISPRLIVVVGILASIGCLYTFWNDDDQHTILKSKSLSSLDSTMTPRTLDSMESSETSDQQPKEGTTTSSTNMTDDELLTAGVAEFRQDRILPGARLLRQVRDPSKLETDKEAQECLHRASLMETLREEVSAPSGWTKQGESHGNRDFLVYYKTDDGGKLTCRIESVIEASLYVPFLCVMNETDLYETWFPSWSFPFKMGIAKSTKLSQPGRCEQVVQLTVNLPFPMSDREIVFWGFADDDCQGHQKVGARLRTIDESYGDGQLVPPPDRGVVRMEFSCDFLFRPCPDDHPALTHSKARYPAGERKILLSTQMYCDPKVGFVPQPFLNFVTRHCIGTVWNMILSVSEQVKEGKRPQHSEVIAAKREEIYDWMEGRAQLLTAAEGQSQIASISSGGIVIQE
mmetsp:Transcript_22784/g.63337  ORF Transcript_22784/g.63337 Transcript_22784/m.63337 type:complete len:412 (+) Transcript_22784:68-1303(+)